MVRHSMTDHYEKFSLQPETLSETEEQMEQMHYDCFCSLQLLGCTQGSGIKPTSGASPRFKVARLSDGEGEARRKAGLMECSESLLLLRLNGGQGATVG